MDDKHTSQRIVAANLIIGVIELPEEAIALTAFLSGPPSQGEANGKMLAWSFGRLVEIPLVEADEATARYDFWVDVHLPFV